MMDSDVNMNTATTTDAKCTDVTDTDHNSYLFLTLEGNFEISKSTFHRK